jgi:hypothetical protein
MIGHATRLSAGPKRETDCMLDAFGSFSRTISMHHNTVYAKDETTALH